MYRGLLFFFLTWLYMAFEGAVLSAIPVRVPPADIALLMALYAAVSSIGPGEVLAVGLLGDLLSGMPLGLGALSKLLLYGGVRRMASGVEVAVGPFFAAAAFLAALGDFLLHEFVTALISPLPPLPPFWILGSATVTALVAWPLLVLNDKIFRVVFRRVPRGGMAGSRYPFAS